ncbi:hypothetical protein O7A70_13675 [Mesorhizobium sp. Cs1299R1N1]|uniref:hypothetical protein n=1 Tax=Mesorhizobium sp. Cs1299R1N1 TaxID=3015172 RepID=UPI00301DD111
MKPDEFQNQHNAAGAAFAASLASLKQAYIELSAWDRAASNGNVASLLPHQTIRSFVGCPTHVPDVLRHPLFAGDNGPEWKPEIDARADQLIKEMSK